MRKELNVPIQSQSHSSLDLARWIAQGLDRKGGRGISIIETIDNNVVADYLVVATGTSSRHMETLLDLPCSELKKMGYPPQCVDKEGSHWFLADLGDVVVHIFDDQGREHYDLEGFLHHAPRVDWIEATPSARPTP